MRNVVYKLSADLAKNPQRVERVQTLTRDRSRPDFGLKGTHGLFGTVEWWGNIEKGVIKSIYVSGVIESLYVAGQDSASEPNAFKLKLDNGSAHCESIYVNCESDASLFEVGRVVDILYVSDELKARTGNGMPEYMTIVMEMAVHS